MLAADKVQNKKVNEYKAFVTKDELKSCGTNGYAVFANVVNYRFEH